MSSDIDVVVEHPTLGLGEILEIHLDTESPIISVLWKNGDISDCTADKLEFFEQTTRFDV